MITACLTEQSGEKNGGKQASINFSNAYDWTHQHFSLENHDIWQNDKELRKNDQTMQIKQWNSCLTFSL